MKMDYLLEEIARWDQGKMPIRMETLMEVVKLVVNPDLEASGRRLWHLMNPKGKDWPDLRPGTRVRYEEMASGLFNAALGGDDDG